MKLFAALLAGCVLMSGVAASHEMMGTHDGHFLWGRFIGDPRDGGKRNCCREGGAGDCQRLDPRDVKIVPFGFEWDGEFIAYWDANISPIDPVTGESEFYGCKHVKGSSQYTGKAHCFFYPASGS
jgi:hypothetical protein